MTHTKDSRGFTLLEMVVVLAVIAILAAILTPIVTSYVDRARLNSARTDVKNIAAAVVQFNTDTKFWPIYSTNTAEDTPTAGTTIAGVLRTDGADVPAAASLNWTTTVLSSSLELATTMNTNFYVRDTTGGPGKSVYRGPYLELSPDPWGSRYYVTATYLRPDNNTNAAYVISAGPNQTFETDYTQVRTGTTAFVAGGDDLVSRIK